MTCASLAIADRRAGFTGPNSTIDQNGDLDCKDVVCNNITINYRLWQPTIETVVLDCVNPTSVPPSAARIPGWTYTLNGTGRSIQLSVQITCYSTNGSSLGYWYLRKGIPDSGRPSIVATGKFYHNQLNVHTTMPTLYYVERTGPTIAMEYFVAIGMNTTVDTNDTCTVTTAVYY